MAAIAIAVLEAFGPARRAHAGAETRARIYAAQVELAAGASRIDPYLVVALIERESSWNPHAVGKALERGLTQVSPTGGAWEAFGPRGASWDAAFSVPVNIRVGVLWMAKKRRHCGTSDPVLWLSAYRGGVCRSTAYSRWIVARAGELRGIGNRVVAGGAQEVIP